MAIQSQPWWLPEPPEKLPKYKFIVSENIVGTIVDIRGVMGSPRYDIVTERNGRVTLPGHSQLSDALINGQAIIGDRVEIAFMGKALSKNGKRYYIYTVKVFGPRDRMKASNLERVLNIVQNPGFQRHREEK